MWVCDAENKRTFLDCICRGTYYVPVKISCHLYGRDKSLSYVHKSDLHRRERIYAFRKPE